MTSQETEFKIGTVNHLIELLQKCQAGGLGDSLVQVNGWGSDEGLGPFSVTGIRKSGENETTTLELIYSSAEQ